MEKGICEGNRNTKREREIKRNFDCDFVDENEYLSSQTVNDFERIYFS